PSALACPLPGRQTPQCPTTQVVVVGLGPFCFNLLGPKIPPPRRTPMKQPSVYLKMRVLGAIDTAQGNTRHQRILNVAAMTFLDEDGNPRQFTWRTIQTWHYRYNN